jgi:FlaA1/EpsC-like NDP-sugar epimerase
MHHPSALLAVDQAETPMHDLWVDLNKLGVGDIIDLQVGDIRDAQQVRDTFEEFRPDIVIHAAAYKHVNMMEGQPWQAFETNVVGTLNVIRAAMASGAERFIQVSTDKAVNPTSVMGATKRLAELLVISQVGRSKTQLITTRFGNVLGSNGSVIPLFRAQIAAGGPVTVTDTEITRFFMTIPEAVSLILQAGAMGQGGDVFLFDMGEAVKILDLAHKMIRLSGLEPEKDIEVRITGMRPGEKLHEELRLDQEDLLPTPHQKIMRVAHTAEIPDDLMEAIQAVAARRADHDAALELLQRCLPEYKGQGVNLVS